MTLLTQLKRVEDVVRTPGPLFRYTTTTTKKMFANTTTSAAAVQHVVDHGRCVSFWCCCGLLFFLSRVSNLNPALCFSLDYCGTDFDRKKKRNTHTRTTTLSPSRKKGPADRIDERTFFFHDDVNDFCVRSFSFVLRSFSTRQTREFWVVESNPIVLLTAAAGWCSMTFCFENNTKKKLLTKKYARVYALSYDTFLQTKKNPTKAFDHKQQQNRRPRGGGKDDAKRRNDDDRRRRRGKTDENRLRVHRVRAVLQNRRLGRRRRLFAN